MAACAGSPQRHNWFHLSKADMATQMATSDGPAPPGDAGSVRAAVSLCTSDGAVSCVAAELCASPESLACITALLGDAWPRIELTPRQAGAGGSGESAKLQRGRAQVLCVPPHLLSSLPANCTAVTTSALMT